MIEGEEQEEGGRGGGPVLREGDIFAKRAFSDISFLLTQGPRIHFAHLEFPKQVFS